MSKDMKYSEVRRIVYNRYHGKCAICGQKLILSEMRISLIVPKSKGGGKDFSNMQCTCESCCKMKHDLTQEEFHRKILKIVKHNFRKFAKEIFQKNQKQETEIKLRKYQETTEKINSGLGKDECMDLIDIAAFFGADIAVDLAFRLGCMKGEDDLKNYLLTSFKAEVE